MAEGARRSAKTASFGLIVGQMPTLSQETCCHLYSRGRAFPALPPNPALREGTRDAMEAWDEGAAAFNDGESPYCLAYRLCRASFASFDSGRAPLAGGVMGVGGGGGEGARRPGGDVW